MGCINMLKLKRVYEAKQVGDIYHYCTLQIAVKYIIPNDTLSPSGKWPNRLIGSSNVLSFTRDKRYIVDILRKDPILVQFKVDGDKVSENHKVFPYNDYYDPDYDVPEYEEELEKEEVVVGKLSPFSNFIKSIKVILNKPVKDLNPLYIQSMLEDIEDYAQSHSIPLEMDKELREILDEG